MAAKVKKAKKPKERKEVVDPAERKEIDAVKLFIFIMFLFIGALGVLLYITKDQLDETQAALDYAVKSYEPMATMYREVKDHLAVITDKGEGALLRQPERFFGGIYSQANIDPRMVSLSPKKETPNRRDRYDEVFWDIGMEKLDRRKATMFLWGVENSSPKARTIEIRMRRAKDDAGADQWRGDFKIGYRVAMVR